MVDEAAARAAIARHRWWHTIEVAPGVVTPGSWDLRPTAERVPWPSSLEGARCLDIGTMDGFWALELAGFTVEATSNRIRDRGGPATLTERPPRAARLLSATGLRGRSLALRARPVYELVSE